MGRVLARWGLSESSGPGCDRCIREGGLSSRQRRCHYAGIQEFQLASTNFLPTYPISVRARRRECDNFCDFDPAFPRSELSTLL